MMVIRNYRENCGICHAITCEHTRAARAIQEAMNQLNQPTQGHPPPDPRDAEIAQLRAALAAGPAALRASSWPMAEDVAEIVETAQDAAMKEGT